MSFWWDSIGGLRRTRDPLDGAIECDVAIVGGGYTGLWTALELRRADPALDVVVLEREAAGFGASGRNGGWLLGRARRACRPAVAGRGRSARPSTRPSRRSRARASTATSSRAAR